jgi:hypothetical protein
MDKDKGGNIVVGLEDNKIVGYDFKQHQYEGFYSRKHFIYIAVDNKSTRQRFWKTINGKAISISGKYCVMEPDNPAKILYEKLGLQ